MDLISLTEVWRYLTWLPMWLLRRIFSRERMVGLVHVDIEPRHDPVEVWLNESGHLSIRFRIINMSPFLVELDRAVISALIGNTRVEINFIHKVEYKAGEISSLRVERKLSPEEARSINRQYDESRLGEVTFTGYFNSKLHSFVIASHQLSGVHAKLINRPKLESIGA